MNLSRNWRTLLLIAIVAGASFVAMFRLSLRLR